MSFSLEPNSARCLFGLGPSGGPSGRLEVIWMDLMSRGSRLIAGAKIPIGGGVVPILLGFFF